MRGSARQDVQDLTSQSESEEEPRMEPKGRAPRGNDLRNERPQVVKGAQVIVERPKEKAKVSRYQTDHSRVDQYSKFVPSSEKRDLLSQGDISPYSESSDHDPFLFRYEPSVPRDPKSLVDGSD
eukprot:TRINITY_DN1051_c0_g1_i4.p1 TRINITY_DN1051_c0_g1~~TRINITY_DN1051_c0_g1_i4.p1  ORF type:complete len:124 (+),score=20.54 TRINITY_DN1051_c0_g1_i4:172-543(+)